MFKRFLPDKQVAKKYLEAGLKFGSAVSYLYMGECVGFSSMLDKLKKWEAEYSKRGFRTIPIEIFTDSAGWGHPLIGENEKLNPDEKPVFHAKIYRENYLGKVAPLVDINAMIANPQIVTGTFPIPTTKDKTT